MKVKITETLDFKENELELKDIMSFAVTYTKLKPWIPKSNRIFIQRTINTLHALYVKEHE